MDAIHVRNVSKKMRVPNKPVETVFDNFSLTVAEGETLGIFGPNGCGKTTLFNMVSGIISPDSGEICINEKHSSQKRIAYIFQDYRNSLFPWLTIRENIIFPLRIRKLGKQQIHNRLDRLLGLTKITFDLSKYPYQLSGGQQQYVAVLRGLISEPDVMLVDEAFSALDYSNTMWLLEKIAETLGRTGISSMVVAHDIEHLVYLADRIVFLSAKPARVLREKTVKKAFNRPRLRFNHDLLDEIKHEMTGMYQHDPFQPMLSEL